MKPKRDLLRGNLALNILGFTVPVILSALLQLFFNAADLIVVGRFDLINGSNAQAAIGTTSSLIHLILCLFMGTSVGINVIVARLYAAKDEKNAKSAVQTSMLIALIGGIGIGIFGYFFAGKFLSLINVPPEVFPLATTYLKIYFIGAPFSVLYNFGAAVMRAAGDTRRPMIYLTAAGFVNIILNLIAVIAFDMGVAGVAIATSASNFVSSLLVIYRLIKTDDIARLDLSRCSLRMRWVKEALAIGIPAGIQSAMFSLSNLVIQSAINSFGASATAGSGNAGNIEGFVFAAMDAFSTAAVTFISYCIGSGRLDKIDKVFKTCVTLVSVLGIVLGVLGYIFGESLLGIYTQNPEDIANGMIRMKYIMATYFICGIMNVIGGSIRGMGQSLVPMIISLVCVCGFRVVWISLMLDKFRSLDTVFISYPISWLLTIFFNLIYYFWVKKKIMQKNLDKQPDL